jgi:hypothetical protein
MSEKVLVLRTCNPDMTAYGGFIWPESGVVEASDWDGGKPVCGGGLHGLLRGCGRGHYLNWSPDARWLVVEADLVDGLVEFDGKCKFRRGTVVYCGDREDATRYLDAHGCADLPVVGAVRCGGDEATVAGGYRATVAGGDWATVTGGYRATVTGGDEATVTGGNRATVTGGNWATVTGGDEATVTGGDEATVTGGDEATVTGGNWATVTGGYRATVAGGGGATVTGGNRATVTGGDEATVTGGDEAELRISYWDGRCRTAVAYVGENGIKPNTPYRLDENHKFVEAKEGE